MAALRFGELCGLVERYNRLTRAPLQIDEYLEQSYLLDPVLEQLVAPLISALRRLLQLPAVDFARPRIYRVARLLYTISKVRGAKSIGMALAVAQHARRADHTFASLQSASFLTKLKISRRSCSC